MAVLIKANRVERYFTCMVQGILWLVAHPCFFYFINAPAIVHIKKKSVGLYEYFFYTLSYHIIDYLIFIKLIKNCVLHIVTSAAPLTG